ncbi:uncharacterized protein HKW66_Vig0170830 [Vigna angularis]|uniref:Uncharacterized protein n=1 Tax=Phaseolus angularis TaxID=3914 RepID=A0A8T0JQH6_PHAAN|nr:uncharacterized protein HKW66_Vig0170830 [Vigna angularis]
MSTTKNHFKDPEHLYSPWSFSKLTAFFFLLISISYLFYSLRFVSHSYDCDQPPHIPTVTHHHTSNPPPEEKPPPFEETNLSHIVFGIGASAKLWKQRKEYIKMWWRPNEMRGVVWLEQRVKTEPGDENSLPLLRISGDTSRFKYKNPKGHRSAIRISRIVSETLRLGMTDVRWFVMGDDDTVFVAENLVKVLQKYDHNQFYYIGSSSESHLQNIYFSYNMAYGGGGFAISYPLAVALEKMQDRCIQRYPGLYGSDDRIQACMAELGVPLTKEKGFHQPARDLWVFRCVRQSLWASGGPSTYTAGVYTSLGRGRAHISKREPGAGSEAAERAHEAGPSRAHAAIYLLRQGPDLDRIRFVGIREAVYDSAANETSTHYIRVQENPDCKWKMEDPTRIKSVEVRKKIDPHLWDKAPRRNCCRVRRTKKKETMVIDVGECRGDEVVEL